MTARYLLALTLAVSGCADPPEDAPAPKVAKAATFVGRQACVECHAEQDPSWRGSHHDLAMQVPDETTVLGDFDDATFTYAGVTTTFFRDGGEFRVRTDGADGELSDFRVAYTFGVEPLQQYLLEFPDGRYQALSICWDTRPASEGGQRWYHLYPGENVDHRDPLHWTGTLQNWNYMCAECHSTNLERNYHPAQDRYETTFSEIDVSCEACHGPGSNHVEWAEAKPDDPTFGLALRLKDSDDATWVFEGDTGNARRSRPRTDRSVIEACGRCHARRSPVTARYEPGRPLADSHRVALLDDVLYHADGQIKDEVYVYGSFLQSKMYREGVSCKDCHDPHSARLHAQGNGVCARCHLPVKYDAPEHHFHPGVGDGTNCVDCHMPAQTYMGVDPRRDHSFRVPRPDLSVSIGTPDACTGCHEDRDADWAAATVTEWYGAERSKTPHYGEALHAGRNWQADAEARLLAVAGDPQVPGIARASAVALLGGYPGPGGLDAVERAASDRDPMVRRAAASALEAFAPADRVRLGYPLLVDPARTVRLQAARVLATAPANLMSSDQLPVLEAALAEYRDSQWNVAERAEAHLNLGWLAIQEGDLEAAEAAYRKALELQPTYAGSYINLADLYRQQGRDGEGEALLRQALGVAPDSGDVHHALGLALVRRRRLDEAIESLARAVELEPDAPRYAYVHGVALQSAGEIDRALAVLESAHRRHPAHRELLYALATLHRDRGDRVAAAEYARKLLRQMPQDAGARELVAQLDAANSAG